MAKLVVLSEGLTGRICELKADRTTVGRLEDNAFQIPEPSVSSHHCEILLRGNDVVVKDLNSTNGSYINGEQISEATLKPGQVLRLGQVELRLENGAAAPPSGKKVMDQTTAIPAGVRLNELETGKHAKNPAVDNLFRKKSNNVNKIFIGVGVALALIVIALLVKAVLSTGG